MKIRWKLFLTLFLLTSVVAGILLVVVEREFRNWVGKQVTESFSRNVEGILVSRKERLENVRVNAEALAKHPAVAAALEGEVTGEQREDMLEQLRNVRGVVREQGLPTSGASGAGRSGGGKAGRLKSGDRGRGLPPMGVVDLDGEFQFFGQAVTVRARRRREAAAGRLEEFSGDEGSQVSYVAVMGEEGRGTRVLEVVVAPVDVAGELGGWFFLGVDVGTTSLERAFQEVEAINGRGMVSGLVVDDEWLVSGVAPEVLEAFASEVDEGFWTDREPDLVEVGGESYLVVSRDLNPGSPLGKGYQVGVFPLGYLVEAIGRLRWTVGGFGLAALLVAGVTSMVFARRFSRPIDELVKGTVRVRAGDFQSEVRIESRDEFGELAGSFNEMTRELGLKEKYRDLLGKTSDPGLVQRLLDGKIELGGELRQAAVLFCDIRGFTEMTDGMDPAEVIELLNGHMIAMTRVIHDHGGVVDKFVGDLVMGVFGVPAGKEGDLERALACGLAMQEERERLNGDGTRAIETGIGIAWGEVVAGLMGSRERMNYTVLGERVNLAARLCGAAGAGEVLVDGSTAEAIGDSRWFKTRGAMAMKGFRETVEVLEVNRGHEKRPPVAR